jgi:hypothetical protein
MRRGRHRVARRPGPAVRPRERLGPVIAHTYGASASRWRYPVAYVPGLIHTGRVGRTVSAVVTWGEAYLGVIGPFTVSTPWWSEVEPVVARLHEVLDVPPAQARSGSRPRPPSPPASNPQKGSTASAIPRLPSVPPYAAPRRETPHSQALQAPQGELLSSQARSPVPSGRSPLPSMLRDSNRWS